VENFGDGGLSCISLAPSAVDAEPYPIVIGAGGPYAFGTDVARIPGLGCLTGFIISDRRKPHESLEGHDRRAALVAVTPRANKSQQDLKSHFHVSRVFDA
jgi:hypothetical protein